MLSAASHAGIAVCNRDFESGLPRGLPLSGNPRSNVHDPMIAAFRIRLILRFFLLADFQCATQKHRKASNSGRESAETLAADVHHGGAESESESLTAHQGCQRRLGARDGGSAGGSRSGQVTARYVARPKPRTMRITRQAAWA